MGVPTSLLCAGCLAETQYMYEYLGYPIGLVATDWSGTSVEAWSSPDALAKCKGKYG